MDAVEHGPSSPQSHCEDATSEDCLFLNVYSPALRDRARRPVMFYIHGGAYNNGSGSSPLYIDVPARMEDDPRGAERRLFAKVPYVQPGT